jgi:Protein of unknown function (DUF3891)
VVLRHDEAGVLAVGQASHAWLCGQLARAWGNQRFGAVEPLDEVALGAEQHDVGMARWDLEPVRDADSGLPKSFMEMGAAANAQLWSRGPQRLVTQSRYAALLAIMHGRRLYASFDLAAASAADAEAVTAFRRHAAELETSLLAGLRDDPVTAPHARPERIARNSQLVWIWDTISLALLLDWAPITLHAVPAAAAQAAEVTMKPVSPGVASLDPWPFAGDETRLHCEGRRLTGGFPDDATLARGLAQARWETLQFTLVPGAELRAGG